MSLRIDKAHWLTTQNMIILASFNRTSAVPMGGKVVWPYSFPKFGAYIGDETETQFSFRNPSRKIKDFFGGKGHHEVYNKVTGVRQHNKHLFGVYRLHVSTC